MLVSLALFALGLALIVKGGDLFVSSSIRIAELLDMPRIVIGSTLVSLATTSPELVVSITSATEGIPGLAVGNAIGSCICNVGLVLGVTAVRKHVHLHQDTIRVPLAVTFVLALLIAAITVDLSLSRLEGFGLVVAGFAYFAFDFERHRRAPRAYERKEAAAIEREVRGPELAAAGPAAVAARFTAGAVLVIVGSRLLVDSAMIIATALEVPPLVIGLTVVAVGTSLPELVTAIASSRRDASDLAVGNVLGAGIANLSFVVGSAAAIRPLAIERTDQVLNFSALLAVLALLLYATRSGNQISRSEGMMLIGYYAAYLALVVAVTGLG